MYLHKLTIFGFKSFAKKTELSFGKGISAIVGPNGCGKTNILDAIRWVIGEQKVKALRSASMQDVIFKGSRERNPLNLAEVQLTLKECKGLLPYDPHAETVIIGRRLYRSGDSEYLINEQPVRLKDIHSVLMGTGIGSSIYALIEQSMIQRILAGGKEDRRSLLEEAAGIMKYKIDRKASESKLVSTETDLDRLEDILVEVKKNVNSLKRQMRRSRDLQKLKSQAQEIAIKIAVTRFERINIKRDAFSRELAALEEKSALARAKRSELEARRQAISVERDESESAVSKAGENLRKVESHIAEKEKELAVLTERIAHAEEGIRDSQTEIESAQRKISELNHETAENESKSEDARIVANKLKLASDELIDSQTEAETVYLSIRRRNSELREELTETRTILTKTRTSIGSLQGRLDSIGKQREEAENSRADLKSKIEIIIKRVETYQNDVETETKAHAEIIEQLDGIRAEISDLSKRESELNEEISRLESEKSGADGRLQALLDSSLKHDDPALLKKIFDGREGFVGRVSDLVRPGTLSAAALDRILGEIAGAWVIETAAEAEKIALDLSSAGARAALIVLEELPPAETENAIAEERVIGLLSFVADYKSGENDAEYFVAKDGAYLRKPGIRLVGPPEKGAISFAGEIAELSKKLENLDTRLLALQTEHSALVEHKSGVSGKSSDIEKRERELGLRLLNAGNRLREAQFELKSSEDRVAEISLGLSRLGEAELEHDSELESIRKKTADLDIKANKLESKLKTRSKEEAEAEESTRLATKKASESQMQYITAKGELERFERESNRLDLQRREAESSAQLARKRAIELKNELEKSRESSHGLSGTIEQFVREKDMVEGDFDKATETAQKVNERLREIDLELRDAAAKVSEMEKHVHERSMEKHEQEMQAGFIRENLESDYGINIDEIEVDEILSDEEDRKAQVKLERLKGRIADFGGVNPEAEVEYESEKQRLDFLTTQQADLVEAKDNLRKIIRKLNNTARHQFLETFEETRRNFRSIFADLFEGGEADLKLQEGEDVLEADIEISARPPGKRFLLINQLSQGEKALCAVSLLFGLYKVKPSPFCMLDEVDAPLDEVNVGRFLRLIRKFTMDTQFILITHNKRTMEATDFLYGVTMQEDGVSKAISLKISDLVLDFEGK